MTPADLQVLLEYNFWARDRLLDAVAVLPPHQFTRDLGSSFPSVRDTLVHIYGAEWIWCARWYGTSPSSGPSPDEFPDVPTLASSWTEVERKIHGFVAGLDQAGLERTIEYRLLSGRPGASRVGEMVQHVVNHGTYHRGQVTTMLRQLGAAPPKSLDLIAFYRERASINPAVT